MTTRCGSEGYAAPELIIRGGRRTLVPSDKDTDNDGYDARETDSWACGVVLYSLICRCLPFGEDPPEPRQRNKWLVKIASADWRWPSLPPVTPTTPRTTTVSSENGGVVVEEPESEELSGSQLLQSSLARSVVEQLLVRDPTKRAKVGDLLSHEWVASASVNNVGIDADWVETPKFSAGVLSSSPGPSPSLKPLQLVDPDMSPPPSPLRSSITLEDLLRHDDAETPKSSLPFFGQQTNGVGANRNGADGDEDEDEEEDEHENLKPGLLLAEEVPNVVREEVFPS